MTLIEYLKNDDQLYYAIIHAFEQLYRYDNYLISHISPYIESNQNRNDEKTYVSERSIVFRFAHYFQNELMETKYKDFHLDCEYNRNGAFSKRLEELDKNTIPDLILHIRGNNINNILIMEFKGHWDNNQKYDTRKIKAYMSEKEEYRFKYGIAALIEKDHIKLTLVDKDNKYEYERKYP